MEDKMKCPICGKENRYIYFDESLGRVEEYYSCDNCGYNLEKSYSPIHEWIDLDKWNINKLKELWNKEHLMPRGLRANLPVYDDLSNLNYSEVLI